MNFRPWLDRAKKRFWRIAISLKFAVAVLSGLTLAMIAATFLESAYDAPTARYWIYRAPWFYALLVALGVNIFCVAWSRRPWKKSHGPFLLAHLGILMMLLGSWIQAGLGIDGTLVLQEGESLSVVELEGHQLAVLNPENSDLRWLDVPWRPAMAAFRPMAVPGFPLRIEEYLSHAEPKVSFGPISAPVESGPAAPSAVKLKVEAPWMGIAQEVWLFGGDFSQSSIALGAGKFILLPPELGFTEVAPGESRLELKFEGPGREVLAYRSTSRKGTVKTGRIAVSRIQNADPDKPLAIETGWVMGMGGASSRGGTGAGIQVKVLEALPYAADQTTYVPSRFQYGDGLPPAAIRLGEKEWLGLGDRRRILAERAYDVAFQAQRIRIPFSIRLEQFKIEHDPGTRQPASYSSLVSVIDPQKTFSTWITMNEPLHWGGYTFYQASYIPGEPRPTISVFSVNRDPGRGLKYLGSILIVLGSIWLFAVKSAAWKVAKSNAL